MVWPESKVFLGTGGLAKVKGTIDAHLFQASFMAMGNGTQMLPIKRETRTLIGKDVGDEVEIHLLERVG